MKKVSVKIVTVGHLVYPIDYKIICTWRSDFFTIDKTIDNYKLNGDSSGDEGEYLDVQLEEIISTNFEGDFLLAIVNVPLEDNYYARRLTKNRICISLYEMAEILNYSNINLENFIIKMVYEYVLMYIAKNAIPIDSKFIIHDETKRCLFDMNITKSDIIHSCDKPILCDDCYVKLSNQNVPLNTLDKIRKEIRGIKKDSIYRIVDFVKRRPLLSLLLSLLAALIINLVSNWIFYLLTDC